MNPPSPFFHLIWLIAWSRQVTRKENVFYFSHFFSHSCACACACVSLLFSSSLLSGAFPELLLLSLPVLSFWFLASDERSILWRQKCSDLLSWFYCWKDSCWESELVVFCVDEWMSGMCWTGKKHLHSYRLSHILHLPSTSHIKTTSNTPPATRIIQNWNQNQNQNPFIDKSFATT